MVQLRNGFSCETDKIEVTNKLSIKEVSLVVYMRLIFDSLSPLKKLMWT